MKVISTGTVKKLQDGVILADGLSDAGYNEVVKIYAQGGKPIDGLVLNLETEQTGIIALGSSGEIREGDQIQVTGKLLSIEVSDALLGRVINSLGEPIDGKGAIEHKGSRVMNLEKIAPDVLSRDDVSRPLQTGIMAVDALTPIGRGQRQLIIGDRQTGKTALALDTILNQNQSAKELNLPLVKCIYVVIGQKVSKVAQIVRRLEESGALANTIVVVAGASDPASLQYIAPLAGTAIGEFFAERGDDALVVYDDLTKHAWAYREISLLLRRPPGREAYPGDIFYLHSGLLERSVQFSSKKGGGSLTALPIIETQAGDVSAYIPTNIISITDGQIYLESDLFYAGIRPAINVGLSVSRVGGSAQIKAMKQVSGKLRFDLAQYRELAAFAQFGSDLDEDTKRKLNRGEKMSELLKQPQYTPIVAAEQIVYLFAGISGYLDALPTHSLADWRKQLRSVLGTQGEEVLSLLAQGQKIEGDIEAKLKRLIETVKVN